jgi:hypothetical protein
LLFKENIGLYHIPRDPPSERDEVSEENIQNRNFPKTGEIIPDTREPKTLPKGKRSDSL